MLKRRSDSYSQGFTLTEMVVALTVFGLVSLSVVNTIGVIQEAQRNEHYLDLANTTAKQIIEEARNGQYATLTASTSGVTYDRTSEVPSTLPSGSASVVVSNSSSMPDFKRLDVTVTYKIGSLTRSVSQSAIIGQGGIAP